MSQSSTGLSTSNSASLTGAWNSLFSSSSDPQVSWQKPWSPGAADILHANATAAAVATAVHQSAAFAALFDDMVSSLSGENFLTRHPTLRQSTAQSSAASLCDSATSFSFKTTRHERTQHVAPHQHLQAQPDSEHVAQIPGHLINSFLIASGQEDLAATLKHWQSSKQTLAQTQSDQATADQQQPELFNQPAALPLPQCQEEAVFWGQPVAAVSEKHQHAALTAKLDLKVNSPGGDGLGPEPIAAHKGHVGSAKQLGSRVRRHSRVRKHELSQGAKDVKPWRTVQPMGPQEARIGDDGYAANTTASQEMQLQLNKVAWWLDLHASSPFSPASTAVTGAAHNALSSEASLPGTKATLLHAAVQMPVTASAAAAACKTPAAMPTSASSAPGPKLKGHKAAFAVPKHALSTAVPQSRPGHTKAEAQLSADLGQQAKQGGLQRNKSLNTGAMMLPSQPASASTELFLKLEAAAAHEPESGNVSEPAVSTVADSHTAHADSPTPQAQTQAASELSSAQSCSTPGPATDLQTAAQYPNGNQPNAAVTTQSHSQTQQQSQEDDPYAGLERGSNTGSAGLLSIPQAAAAQPSPQPGSPYHTGSPGAAAMNVPSDLSLVARKPSAGSPWTQAAAMVPGQGTSSDSPVTGVHTLKAPLAIKPDRFSFAAHSGCSPSPSLHPDTGPNPTSSQDRAEAPVDARGRGKRTQSEEAVDARGRGQGGLPAAKAAEGPLVKQGSYAVAVRQARWRQEQRQKELDALRAQHAQQRAASLKQASQAEKGSTAPQSGLLIGSYSHPAAALAPTTPQGTPPGDAGTPSHPKQPHTPLVSRPSTVVSANYRYASTLATEASSTCSEPEPLTRSQSVSSDVGTAEEEVGSQRAAVLKQKAAAQCAMGNGDLGRAKAGSQKPGLLKRKAAAESGRASSGLQAQLRLQHPFTPLTAGTESGRPYHPPRGPHCSSPLVQQQQAQQLNLQQQQHLQAQSAEESQLLASLQRLDVQLGVVYPQAGFSAHAMQPSSLSQQEHEAKRPGTTNHAAVEGPKSSSKASRLPLARAAKHRPLKQNTPSALEQPKPIAQEHSVHSASGSAASVRRTAVPVRRGAWPSPPPLQQVNESRSKGRAGARAEGTESSAGAACPSVLPLELGNGPQAGTRRQLGRGKMKKRTACEPTAAAAAAAEVHDSRENVSNSAEQRLLQSSLARLDARLTSLAARCTGSQGQPPPAPASAPLTRQPSSFLAPASPSSLSPFPSGANRGPDAAHEKLPGPFNGSPKGTVRTSPAGSPVQLPRLQACPSVASAPCTSGSIPTRRYPGDPDSSPKTPHVPCVAGMVEGTTGIAAALTAGPSGRSAAAARAALLAEAPSAAPPLPRQAPQTPLPPEGPSHLASHSSTFAMQEGGQMAVPQSVGMMHFLPAVPSYWRQQHPHQQQQQQQHQMQQQQQQSQMYGRTDDFAQQRCMQPMLASMHPFSSNSQQSWGAGASAAPSFVDWQSNARLAQQHNSAGQMSTGLPMWDPNQHAPSGMSHQAAMHQLPLQAGTAAYAAAASAVPMVVNAASSPWVQRTWYPTMPGGLHMPLGAPYLHAEPSQQRPVAPAEAALQRGDQQFTAECAENLPTGMVRQGLQNADQQARSAALASQTLQPQSSQMQHAHGQQSAAARTHVNGHVSDGSHLRCLPKGRAQQKGVIKAYNLEALMN